MAYRKKTGRVELLGLLTLLGSLLLSGCGFHLRGAVVLPPAMERTAVNGIAPNGPLGRRIADTLTGAGGTLVSGPESATAVLQVMSEGFDRRLLGVDSSGQANQYELSYHITYQLLSPAGKPLLDQQTVSATRSYSFDPNNVLTMDQQEGTLKEDLRRTAVGQMMRQVAAGMRSRGSAPASEGKEAPAP